MKQRFKCGNYLDDNQNFCANCGTAINGYDNNFSNINTQNNLTSNDNPNNSVSNMTTSFQNLDNNINQDNNFSGMSTNNSSTASSYQVNSMISSKDSGGSTIPRISKRNIVGAVIFCIITCGLFGVFWQFWIINDTKKLTGDNKITTLPLVLIIVMSLLFYILTFISPILGIIDLIIICGCIIYTYYLNYKIGRGLYLAGQQYNKVVSDYSIIYLVLSIFGVGIGYMINMCLMQNDLNKFGVNKGE